MRLTADHLLLMKIEQKQSKFSKYLDLIKAGKGLNKYIFQVINSTTALVKDICDRAYENNP